MDHRVIIGYAPTRRRIFSAEDAVKYKKIISGKMKSMGLEFVDIEDINSEGLLRCAEDVEPVINKFKAAGVNALFIPHCNFGSEHSCGKVARALGVPVLLWGPRDEAPLADGSRLRDTQCGLFATGKVLRRMRVPFTYLPNCRVEDELFERGLRTFTAAANVVKEVRRGRILQIDTRPADFWTMMVNEGELLERFGVQVFPINMVEFVGRVKSLEESDNAEVASTVKYINENMEVCVPQESVRRVASLKTAMKLYAQENGCNAVAIQCWDALQQALHIMPCCANALLTDEGIPVVCETDIHGAVTAIMVQAAAMGKTPSFFVDWSVRHPVNDNGELLQHCGPWPISLARDKAKLDRPFAFPEHCPGSVVAELKPGEISLFRFDGDNGEYGMLMGTAKTIEGPKTQGTYVWIEVPNWSRVESMIVKGPYVHHAVGIHGNVLPVIHEALTYIPDVKEDFYDEDQRKRTLNYFFE
ncbi:MAG: L-fucose/L-arabinose isomerase family protein [Treponema sp.]|jgi:L-fucose isomerase-like protein|nr:L-fucose/L-arabinose isomerase family protein [Treponema sp.]